PLARLALPHPPPAHPSVRPSACPPSGLPPPAPKSPPSASRAGGGSPAPSPAGTPRSDRRSSDPLPGEGTEGIPELGPGAGQLRLGGPLLDAQSRADLLVRVALYIVHEKHRAIPLRQPVNGLLQPNL